MTDRTMLDTMPRVRKRRWAVRLCVGALAALAAGCGPSEPGELIDYVNADFGFRLRHPSNWAPGVDPEPLVGPQPSTVHAVAFVDSAAQTAAVVYVQPLTQTQTLDAFAAEQVAGLRAVTPNIELSESSEVTLGGQPARQLDAAFEQDGQAFRARLLLAVKGARGYALTLTAPVDSPRTAILDAMLASFEFES